MKQLLDILHNLGSVDFRVLLNLGYARCLLVITFFILLASGCYQVHSDDDLRSVPTTNNPNILPNGGRGSPAPKAGF